MAQSTCIRCGGTTFEIRENEHVVGTDLVLNFVQCNGCGGVVGVMDYYSLGGVVRTLEQIKRKLGISR